ncbi:uncharacterized protein LAJ45_10771 [Morchella importuna]|uniref:uncharacterized protein n=1 Tax=Morchella importuna TaxID=1174673 RepID=UPI001E8E66FF|nr:uncharacterized protein LAJ45_10771 [Morchella importuna]KAH8145210.1 hypothetical protein LAJ45_10771 [Morchella importuna]
MDQLVLHTTTTASSHPEMSISIVWCSESLITSRQTDNIILKKSPGALNADEETVEFEELETIRSQKLAEDRWAQYHCPLPHIATYHGEKDECLSVLVVSEEVIVLNL